MPGTTPAAAPTAQQLAEALTALHQHQLLLHVATLEKALANPVAACLVHMHARLHASGVATLGVTQQRPVVKAPEPPHPVHAVPPPRPYSPPRGHRELFDPKTAAAGDHADD